LAGFFGASGVTRLFAQHLPRFLACGLPHPRVIAARLADTLGFAGAGVLVGAVRSPLFIAGSCRGAGRLAQPRRRAKQIGFELAFDIAVAAAMMARMAAPGIAFVPALRIRLRFVIARVARAAALAARRIV
jgi:hypothetical protein